MKKNADRLRQALAESHALATRLDESGFALAEFERLQSWQRRRLAGTYRQLIGQDRYRAAAEFFLTELYGGLNFRERDQQMEKVLPVMVRMLREDMLAVLAEAFELQSLSLSLDMDMTAALRAQGWKTLDNDRYGQLYRLCGRYPDRDRQIELIKHLGMELNRLVHHRLVLWMIRTVRGPARAAGFGRLQAFLERGLTAFRAIGDGREFVDAIWRTETLVKSRLVAGAEHPFRGVYSSPKLQPK